jgi:hypothetical protein
MIYNTFYILLNDICYYLLMDFYIYTLQDIGLRFIFLILFLVVL